MINAYEIATSATLKDDVTPVLDRIIAGLDKANTAMLEFSERLRVMSAGGASLARNLDKAAAASTALGDSSAGLTRASYVLDTMVGSSADVARNLAAARAEANGLRVPGGGVPGGGGGSGGSGGSRPSGGTVGSATGVATAGMLFGAYENARLSDQNVKAVATAQVPFDQWQPNLEDLRNREMEYASKYAWATGGRIEPFGESMLEGSRLLRTLSAAKQKEMMDFAMPYIALEAKLKGVSMPESTDAFVGLAHMAGAYDPQQAQPLFESMLQASLTSHASLGQIARAASYALPALHAAGANSSDVMLLVATMMQGGIMNTKSGTWLNAMAMNSLPNTLGSGLFSNKKQNKALHELGLYHGNQSMFYSHGSMDLMKIVSILAADREKMEPLKFNALLKMAFGTQGQRGASFFSEDTTLQNLHALSDLKNFSQPPMDVGKMISQVSTVGLADQTIANANITLMNGSATLMGPVNSALSGAGSFFAKTAQFTKDNPVAGGLLDFGMLFGGAVAGLGAWSGAKGAAGMLEKGVVGLSKYIGRTTASLIGRAFLGIGAEEIGAASLAAIGGELAIGAVIAGGIAAALAAGLKWAMDKIPTTAPPADWHPKGIDPSAPHGSTAGHPSYAHQVTRPAEAATPTVNVKVQVDGHDVAAHVQTKLIPQKSIGPTGMNPDAAPFSPAMGMY